MTDLELPFPFSLIFEYFWLLTIVFAIISIPIFKARVNQYIQQDPSLEGGYNKLILGYVLFIIIPWLVMGVGILFGKLDTFFDVIYGLRTWEPFSVLFFGTIIALMILACIWVWFWGGAEFLVKHHGILNRAEESTTLIKIRFAVIMAASIMAPFLFLNGILRF